MRLYKIKNPAIPPDFLGIDILKNDFLSLYRKLVGGYHSDEIS